MGYNINDSHCNSTGGVICTFDVVNGIVLSIFGVLGLILNIAVIAIARKVHLPGKQRYFITNLAIADTLLALAGTQRGLGLVSTDLLIGGPRTSAFCVIFALALNFVGWALIPITIERFVALVVPFKLQKLLTKQNCLLLCVTGWVPNIVCLIFETFSLLSDSPESLQVTYDPLYGRCTYNTHQLLDLYVFVKGIICFVVPLTLIVVCYVVIFVILVRKGIGTKRVLVISTLIVVTGVAAWAPTVIVHYADLEISKPVSHIFTITFFYSIGVLDPLIFIFGYKNMRAYMRGRRYYREHRRSELSGMDDMQEFRTGSTRSYIRGIRLVSISSSS
ncbi:hypothetical protein ACHWQZ_G002519 [Mnemiopsis leidyi]